MENCQTIKINNNLKNKNNFINNTNNNYNNNLLNSNNKKKLEINSESSINKEYIKTIKRKKLNNNKNNDTILFLNSNKKIIDNKTNKENNPPSNTINTTIEKNLTENLSNLNHTYSKMEETTTNNANTLTENKIIEETIDITEDTSSVLPTPPQTPKTSYNSEISENTTNINNNNENDNLINKESTESIDVTKENNEEQSNIIDNNKNNEENEKNGNDSEEYESININDESDDIINNNDITSVTSLPSVDNEDVSIINTTSSISNNENSENIENSFENANVISLGNLINPNSSIGTNNDPTLNSGDSTLIQHSSLSSYIDKEDEDISESSIYIKKFKLYTANASQPKNPRITGLPSICKEDCGEDAYFVLDQPNFSALGIADGVGGWTFLGYDPSLFAWDLMNCCKESATNSNWPDPQDILVTGYNKVVEKNEIEAGSSTACIITLDKTTGTVYSSNIGDSGFIVIRNGKVAYQTQELQHYFNAPYQLSVLPEEMKNDPINIMDSPSDAIIDQCTVEEGDVIVLGTDGLWDNIFNEEIITKLSSSIEKIDDIQKQIKSINENYYQLQQKQKQLNGNTEAVESNNNDNENENENENRDDEDNLKKDNKETKEEKKEDEIDNEMKKEQKIENETENSQEVDNKDNNTKKENDNDNDNVNSNNNEINIQIISNIDEKTEENDDISSCQTIEEMIQKKKDLNEECNRILKEIAVKLTLDTREMSRNFDKISPFSYNAKKCGIIHYGGKIDDITVIVAYVSAADDIEIENKN